MVTQAPAIAFACFQLATLARNTQAPATAFACSQLAALAQKKRLGPYLSASAFLGGFPPPNPPHDVLNLLAYLAPTSFSFGEGACSSPPLRKNDRRIPPEQTCCHVLWLAATKKRIPPIACYTPGTNGAICVYDYRKR